MASVKHSICDICTPGVHCGVNVIVEDGKIQRIEGREDFPPNFGTLCVKGAVGRQYVMREDRIKTPMRRVGEKGSGEFEAISWAEAINTIAEKFNESKAGFGPEATAFVCGYAKWFRAFFQRLAYAFGSPNYITESSTCHKANVLANTCVFGSNVLPDTNGAKLIILWGYDAFTKNVTMGKRFLDQKETGVRFVVIDSRKTATADKLADVYVRPRLGTDGAIALAMANYLIEAGLYDKEFVEKYVHGFEAFRDLTKEFTLERAEQISKVPASVIKDIAEEFAKTDPSVICIGNGMPHRTNGFNNLRAILAVEAICGRFDRPGTLRPGSGPMTFAYSSAGFRSREPEFMYSLKPEGGAFDVGKERFPLFVDKIKEAQGMDLTRQICSGEPYPIKTAFFAGVNSMMYPDTEKFMEAVSKLDFVAASDLFWTDACRAADIVLPVCSSFERSEIKCYAGSLMYYTKPAIEPLYDSRPDTDIFFDLARALKLEDELITSDYDTCARWMLEEASGLESWEAFRESDEPVKAPNAGARPWGEALEKGVNTPTGKIELYSETVAAYGRDEMNPLPVYLENEDRADPAVYDMVMCGGARIQNAIHSRLHDCEWARSLRPLASVDINLEDAKRLQIARGDRVRISTPTGKIELFANITPSCGKGELQLFHGYKEANVNSILDGEMLDPYTGFPSYKQFRCRIEKI